MTVEAQRLSSSSPSGRTHPPRKLRNYLLEPRFQLKYTCMVVGVTVVVASVLGWFAYQYSTGQTELLNIERMETKGSAADQQFVSDLQRYAREADRKVLLRVLAGIGVLAFSLGLTGIVVTHRLVGPAYRLKRMLRQIRAGRLDAPGTLRKNDELQDVFEAFQQMRASLVANRVRQIEALDAALERASTPGADREAWEMIRALRDQLRDDGSG